MSDGPLSPEEVAHRGFPTSFRGFDTGQVRAYLQRVANELRTSTTRERELHRRLAEAEHRAANPVIDSDTLTRGLGEEMARILASAQEAASDLKARAEENAARILREAHEQAQRIRAQAEGLLAGRSEEAEAEAAEIRRAAAAEAAGALERARREATAAMDEVEVKTRHLVQEAQTARARIIGDLTRRRRAMITQVEQLRAGRERLLEAYRTVRRTTDEVADELQRVEAEAREVAARAADRVTAEPEPVEELDDVLTAFPEEPPAPAAAAPVEVEVEAVDVEAVEVAAVEVAPEPEVEAAPEAEVQAEVEAQPALALSHEEVGGERPPSTLRLLRRARGDARAGQLDVVESPAEDEGVRVLAPAPEPAAEAGASEVSEEGSPGDAAPAPPAPGVDELFARIRAGRADAVAKAHEVLVADTEGAAGPAVRSGQSTEDDEPDQSSSASADASPSEPVPAPAVDGEEGLLQRRDRAVEGIEARLARKLKRALQDEQNEVLDRLRSSKSGAGGAGTPGVLPPLDEQAGRYRRAAEEQLGAAAAAGAGFVSTGSGSGSDSASGSRPEVADVAEDLAASLAEPLRRAVERALAGEAGADQSVVVERIGAAYRECKAQRIESLAGDAVTAAFSRGALAALAPGKLGRWVVDDDGRPCPDCDDNALAGPTPPGEPFPTGQAHPPAHAGCRCVLAPAEVAAAVNGSG